MTILGTGGGSGEVAAIVRRQATTEDPSGTALTAPMDESSDDEVEVPDDVLDADDEEEDARRYRRFSSLPLLLPSLKCGSLSGIMEKSKKGKRPLCDDDRGRIGPPLSGTWRLELTGASFPSETELERGPVFLLSSSLRVGRSIASEADDALDLKKLLARFDSGVDGGVGGTAFSVGWFKDLLSPDDFSWSVVCGEMENLSGNIEKSAR